MAFNFGTPAGGSAGGGGGFNFGASTPKPAFGTTAAAPAFGTATASFGTAATAAPSAFGANLTLSTTQPAAGLGGFGAVAATPGFEGFGAKPIQSVQPLSLGGLGTGASVAPTLPTFGQAVAAQQQQQQHQQQQQQQQPTLTLGGLGGLGAAAAPAPAAGGGFSFGAAPAAPATASVAPTLGGFGTGFAAPIASSAAPSLGLFGKPATTTTTAAVSAIPSLFGASTTAPAAAPAPTATLGGGGMFGAAPAAAPAAATGGLFGANTSSLFGAPTLNATNNTFAAPAAAPPAAIKLGLGGVDTNAAAPKTVEGRSESARAKETPLPGDFVATVESLKQHIKQQKQCSSDIARTSTHRLFAVSGELQQLNWQLAEVANCVQTNHSAIKQLRYETAGAIRQAEMAQRTHEIQPGLQFENTAPLRFFAELVQKFEADMISFRNQVELTEKHMRSLANPQSFTYDDLKRGLQQIHESFIALAGRLHETHQKVEAQKEQYLNLRKHLLKDRTNVFETGEPGGGGGCGVAAADRLQTMAHISCGPTPFSQTFGIALGVSQGGVPPTTTASQMGAGAPDVSGFGLLGRSQQAQGGFLSAPSAGAMSFGFGSAAAAAAQTSMTGGIGAPATTPAAFGLSSTATGGAFNLQSPPVGTKRNKQ